MVSWREGLELTVEGASRCYLLFFLFPPDCYFWLILSLHMAVQGYGKRWMDSVQIVGVGLEVTDETGQGECALQASAL